MKGIREDAIAKISYRMLLVIGGGFAGMVWWVSAEATKADSTRERVGLVEVKQEKVDTNIQVIREDVVEIKTILKEMRRRN